MEQDLQKRKDNKKENSATFAGLFLEWTGAGDLLYYLQEGTVIMHTPKHIIEYLIPNELWNYLQHNGHSTSFASFTRKEKLPAKVKYMTRLIC